MSNVVRITAVAVTLAMTPALAAEGHPHGAPANSSADAARQEKCEHGVQRSLCARCNPKLVPVYEAKGDWCSEHERPESQCVPCHPELAKKGVK